MTQEQYERASALLARIKELKQAKANLIYHVELTKGWEHEIAIKSYPGNPNAREFHPHKEFIPISGPDYIDLYTAKINAELVRLENEFLNL